MRLLCILITITLLTEAKKRSPERKKKMKPNEDDIPHKADVFPESFMPVPFGHIFREGFQPGLKMPVDLLELNLKYPKDYKFKKFENMNRSIQRNKEVKPRDLVNPNIFQSGKKETIEDKVDVNSDVKEENNNNNKVRKTWHDLVANHVRNLGETLKGPSRGTPQMMTKVTDSNLTPDDTYYNPKEQFFSRSSFDLDIKKRENSPYNWTTCDEFSRNADFHPSDVINIDWVPFYTWASDEIQTSVALIHRFSIPTVKMVQKYKEELGNYINKRLDWNSPKLYLKSNMEMLLIAVGRRGGFYGIPYNEVPKPMSLKQTNLTLPLLSLHLKILDPYLAMMFCDYQYATIMAVSGNEPSTIQEIRAEAATLKFQGRGYPVARDVEAELMAAKMERDSKFLMEKTRFLEDHADFNIPIEV